MKYISVPLYFKNNLACLIFWAWVVIILQSWWMEFSIKIFTTTSRGLSFEIILQLMVQFAHIWYEPCCLHKEACTHVYFIHDGYASRIRHPLFLFGHCWPDIHCPAIECIMFLFRQINFALTLKHTDKCRWRLKSITVSHHMPLDCLFKIVSRITML